MGRERGDESAEQGGVEFTPELLGKLTGIAVRHPLLNASLTDCVFEVRRATTVDEVNAALIEFLKEL